MYKRQDGNMHSLQLGQEYPAGAVSPGNEREYLSRQPQWKISATATMDEDEKIFIERNSLKLKCIHISGGRLTVTT